MAFIMSCSRRQHSCSRERRCSGHSNGGGCANRANCQRWHNISPPSVWQLQQMLCGDPNDMNQMDEVFPNLFLGNAYAAMDTANLRRLGITHILNLAHDTGETWTDAYFYRCMPITYKGLTIIDKPGFSVTRFFYPGTKFINEALSCPGGRILVHCCVTGVSRGSTMVLAYLMMYRNMSLMEAICQVSLRRYIRPNDGFLQELRCLDMQR